MAGKRKFCHWVIIAFKTNWLSLTYLIHDINSIASFFYTKSVAGKYMSVAVCVQFGKSFAKLKFVTINIDGAECAFFALYGISRQKVGIDAEKVTYPCSF